MLKPRYQYHGTRSGSENDFQEYGFGLYTTTYRKNDNVIAHEVVQGHTGSAYGLNSALFFEPNKQYGFVVIINGSEQKYIDGYNAVLKKTVNSLYENIILK